MVAVGVIVGFPTAPSVIWKLNSWPLRCTVRRMTSPGWRDSITVKKVRLIPRALNPALLTVKMGNVDGGFGAVQLVSPLVGVLADVAAPVGADVLACAPVGFNML